MAITLDPLTGTSVTNPATEDSSSVQSAAPDPGFMRDVLGPNPWDVAQAATDETEAQRQQSALEKIDRVALDPDSFFKGKDLTFAADPKKAQVLALNSAFMEFASGDQPVPLGESDLERRLIRQDIAIRRFDGRGADSEESFHAEIVKAAQGRKDVKALGENLSKAAQTAATMALGTTGQPDSWAAARDEIRKMPGYKPEMEPDLHEAFYQAESAARDALAPFASEVKDIWQSWKEAPGAGKFTGVAAGLIKDAFLGGQGETDAALAQKSTRRTAWEIYAKLKPKDQDGFMQALGVLASRIPKEEQPAFFANIAKQSGRDVETLAQQAVTGTVDFFANPTNWDTSSGTGQPTDYRRRADFVQKLQNLREGKYDPVKKVSGGWWGQLGESVAYGTTGVLATSVLASNPYTAPVLFSSLTENHYQSLLQSQTDVGVSYEKASAFATQAAPLAAAIETGSEMLGSHLLRGKLPILDKALTAAMDRLTNKFVRAGTRFVAGALEEGSMEVAQNYIDPAIRGIANAYGAETGKVLLPNLQDNIETMAAVFPLALLGIPGAFRQDVRAAAYRDASTTQLQALGGTAEAIAGINAANGLSSLNDAVDTFMETRDPTTPETQAALDQIKLQQTTSAKAQAALEKLGYAPPRMVHSVNGIAVYDGATGEALGDAPDLNGAVKIARTHTTYLDNLTQDQVAYLGSLFESTSAALELDPNSVHDVHLDQVFDPAQATPAMAARYAQQVALQEQAEGGTGEVSRSVLGYSVTEFAKGMRTTINSLFKGASPVTVFHETFHGLRRAALASGAITRADEISLLLNHDTLFGGKQVRKVGTDLRFVPAGITADMLHTGAIPAELIPAEFQGDGMRYADTILDEGISEIAEMEVLKLRKKDGKGRLGIQRGTVARGLTAVAKAFPEASKKWTAFFRAVRANWGLSMSRAIAMRIAEKKGEFDPAEREAFLNKLLGLDAQAEHEAAVKQEFITMMGGNVEFVDSAFTRAETPFSIGRANTTVFDEAKKAMAATAPAIGDSSSFSLGPAQVADIMAGDALSRVTDPQRRAQMMNRVAKDFQIIRMDAERAGLDQWIGDTKGELRKKAQHMEEMLAEQYVQEVETRRMEILSVDDLTKIKAQPVNAYLANPDSHLRGRLMSKSAAMAKHPDMFEVNRLGDYDGADGISRSVFGGTLMPDHAAQELFDHHLIKAPTADAMWEALKKEQNTVAAMKEMLANAQEEIRAAKLRAKEEATAWGNSQKDLHGLQREESNKAAVTRGIRMLDAITLALPKELHGKMGGHAQMARLGSHEARLKFLQDKLEKADKLLESYLREQARNDMNKLLEQVRPEKSEEGQRPMGRLGPEIHSLFDFLETAMSMNFQETEDRIYEMEGKADRLEEDTEDSNDNEEQAAELRYRAQLVNTFGNWEAADAHRRIEALKIATKLFETGRSEVRARAGIRKRMRQGWRADLVASTDMTGERMERIRKAEKTSKGKISRLKQTVFSLFSYKQALRSVFGHESRAVFIFGERERKASQFRADAESRIWDGIDELFTRLGGNEFKGDQLRAQLATERTITVTDFNGREQRFTAQEAITALLMYQQEDGKRHMQGKMDDEGNPIDDWHWREQDMKVIRDQLSPEARAVMFHLREAYEAEYDRVNAVFRRLFEMNMPKHKFYSQLTVIPFQGSGAQAANPLSGAMTGPGITAVSLKNRTQTKIAEPEFQDALQVFIGHTKQMEHFIHYAELAQDMGAVFNNREVGNVVQAKAGKEALSTLRGWSNYFAQGGVRDEAAHLALNGAANRWIGRAARVALIGRVSVLFLQSLQLGAAAYQMPVGAYLSRLARLGGGRLEWGSAIKSDYIQRRLKQMSPMVRLALEGFDGASPSRLNYLTHKMGNLINGADALFTAGTYAMILDYQLSINGGNVAEAHAEAERLTDEVAQPIRAGERSLFENTTTHPMARMMFAFRSDQRQKIAISAYSLMSESTTGQKAKALAVTWIFGGILQTILRAALRDIRAGDDDKWFDDRYWDPKRLALMAATGPLGGIPYLGDVLEGGLAAAFGVQQPEGNLLSAPINAARTVGTRWDNWAQGDITVGSGLKDAESLLGGFGIGGDIPADAASWMHVARDLWGIADNFTDWGD